MKNTWKKAAAFTLALALVAGAAPANVGTGGLFGGSAIVANAATTVTTIDQLKNASGSVVIGADIEYSEYTFWYYEKNNVDIDLNGHTITLAKAYFGVDNGHTLTIRDSKGDGKILMKRQVRVLNGNVILEGGTLESNYNSGAIGISAGTFTMNGGTITGPKSIQCLVDGSVIINGGNVNGEFNGTGTGLSITGGIFNFDVTSLVNAGVSVTKIGNLWYVGDSAPSIVDISTATVNLAADNSVESITVGDDTITDLSGFDITYGVSDTDHTATSVPTAAGTYYAYVTAKDTNTAYTGTAKSASFEVDAAPTMTNASVTLNDGFGLNFYVDNITDATGYTVMFDGTCDEDGTEAALTEKDGKFFATANVNAKDIKENIAATLYKDGVATDVTLTSSVDAYLTAALADTSFDDKTKALLEATQLYGCTADNYFNNAENDFNQMFDDFLTYAGLESDQTPLYAAINNAVANDNVNDEKVSLVLNSKVKLRIYSDNGTNENNYGKYSEITGLTPLTMGQNQTVGGCSVSGYTWVDRVLEKNEIDKNYYMAMALASYMYAAEALNAPAVPAATPVTAITLNKPATTISAGQTETLSVSSVTPDDATDKTVTWSSDNEAVATVNATTGEVTAVAAGTANITATANDGSGVTATCAVTVTPATITVTWNNDDITGTDAYGTSFTKDGVTITAEEIYFPSKNFMNGGTFTTTLGNFTKIEVTTDIWDASGAGWSGSTWTGNASSVSFSDSIVGNGMGNTKFVFTIAPTN